MTLAPPAMSEDAKAILLLCGRFGGRGGVEPLDLTHYNAIAHWLAGAGLRPHDLLDPRHLRVAAEATGIGTERIGALLDRGMQLGVLVERWSRAGVWIVGRCDDEYPRRLKAHLREQAPPILFGAGDRSLLRGGGVAIVGSRSVDEAGVEFAQRVAERCAMQRVPVVSGGARGVDQVAMTAALGAGGEVLGVLADSLLRTSTSREAREAIADGRLTLLSPWHPEAGFSVGGAMGRNKLIYAMADHAVVVSTDHEKGGTWSGAVEELRRPRHRPLFVRVDAKAPPGNPGLLPLGAIAWPTIDADADLVAALAAAAGAAEGPTATAAEPPGNGMLFDDAIDAGPLASVPKRGRSGRAAAVPDAPSLDGREHAESVRDASAPNASVRGESARTGVESAAPRGQAGDAAAEAEATAHRTAAASPAPATAYDAVLPLLLRLLDAPTAADPLAARLEVAKPQLMAWLKRAVAEDRVRRLQRPVRYVRAGGADRT